MRHMALVDLIEVYINLKYSGLTMRMANSRLSNIGVKPMYSVSGDKDRKENGCPWNFHRTG